MPRTGILTGIVTDEFGDPIMGMQVRAWRYVKRSGERTLQSASYATTDDRGIYRIAGLVPGEYLVGTGARDTSETMMLEVMKMRETMVERTISATVADGRATWSYAVPAISGSGSNHPTSGYASVYYPGTLQSASATAVTLGISEERSGVDVQLQVVPLARNYGIHHRSGWRTAARWGGSPRREWIDASHGQGFFGSGSCGRHVHVSAVCRPVSTRSRPAPTRRSRCTSSMSITTAPSPSKESRFA